MRVPAPLAKPLARELSLAAPRDLDARERAALEHVDGVAERILDVLSQRDRETAPLIRGPMIALGNVWSATFEGLGARARMPNGAGEHAALLQASLFPNGLTFVNVQGRTVWSESTRRLRRIDREGMRDDIDAILGPDMVPMIEEATARLGAALGLGHHRRGPSRTALQEELRRFSHAVGRYGRTLAANADEEDPASIERLRAAVAPMDAYRARMARGGADVDLDESDTDVDDSDVEPPADDTDAPVTDPIV